MKLKSVLTVIIVLTFAQCNLSSVDNGSFSNEKKFNISKDLLLLHYDCKTDVDDLHSVAAFATLLSDTAYAKINYHAVAGTYGVQEGLYVPPNQLFQLSFGNRWSDAHNHINAAIEKEKNLIESTIIRGGDVWIAEGGQSDFSANVIKAVLLDSLKIDLLKGIHIIQHGDWNEEMTSPDNLEFIKQHVDYKKIPDGNTVGNGTPGFKTPDFDIWKVHMSSPELIKIWHKAIDIGNEYNGRDGRFLNEAISSGGLDFSDFAAVCWILGLNDIKDTDHFFRRFGK